MGIERIHFLHTNDLHSHFENVPKMVFKMQELRNMWERQGETVITLDVGDHMDRMHLITEGTMGKANVEVLTASGVDMVTLGNNEGLTFAKEQLEGLYERVPFQVVLSNMVDKENGEVPPWLTAFALQVVSGLRIGFLGLTVDFNDFYELLGWKVLPPLEVAKKWVAQKRDDVDLWVVLSHLGIRYDYQLAEHLPSESLIFGAHTHNILPHGERVHQVTVAEAGKFGDYLGHVAVDIDTKRRKVMQTHAKLFPIIGEKEEDPFVQNLLYEQEKLAHRAMQEEVVQLDEDLTLSYEGDSPLANLLADGLLDWVGADLSIVNSGQLIYPIKKGKVTKKKIHATCPSPINPCRMVLIGSQILRLLEETLLSEYRLKVIRGFGFRGKQLGQLVLSGMRVHYDAHEKPFHRIKRVYVGQRLLEQDHHYRVATIDMFTFGAGHTEFLSGKEVEYLLPEFLRDVLEKQLLKEESLARCKIRRWITEEERGEGF